MSDIVAILSLCVSLLQLMVSVLMYKDQHPVRRSSEDKE